MATDIFQEDDDLISQINIVPFVDIVLVLLIIFMLTSSVIVRASILVDLPHAASAGETVSSTLNVVLHADGQLFLNGRAITIEALSAHVARASWKEEDLQAVISADTRVDYGKVIRIIDAVKNNGVKSFALNVQREY